MKESLSVSFMCIMLLLQDSYNCKSIKIYT